MKKYKIESIIALMLGVLLCLSCNVTNPLDSVWMSQTQHEEIPTLSPNEIYSKFLKVSETGYKGIIKFHAFAPLGLAPMSPKVRGAFYDIETGLARTEGNIEVAGHRLLIQDEGSIYAGEHNGERDTYLSEFWGKEISIKMSVFENKMEIDTMIYSPALLTNLSIQSSIGELPENARMHSVIISEGTVLTWDADENNGSILILASYQPDEEQNREAEAAGFTQSFNIGKSVKDIGSYVVSAEDMKHLPNGSLIDISIIRGVFETIKGKQSGDIYALKGYSIIKVDGYIVK